MTMTSAVAPHFGGDGQISFTDRTYPEPQAGQLLIAVEANAICGTDRDQYFGGSDVVPGHEAAGTVIAAGTGTSTAIGTRGAVFLMDYCGSCRSCRLGHTNQCLAKRADMGFTHDGGYGPYEVVRDSNFFAVPQSVSAADATLLLDVMGTSSHALNRIGKIREDVESLYVAGAGPIGLGILVMAKLRFGEHFPVHITDISPWRLNFAESLGGTPVDASDTVAVAAVPACDAAIDSTGKTGARAAAVKSLGKRGVLVCVGHGQELLLNVSDDLIAPERAILGSEYFRFDEMPANLELLLAHRDYIAEIATHQVPVTDIAEGFAMFLAGETGKVIVTQEVHQ